MEYISTRGNYEKVSAAEAIRTGMVPRGGLFVPERIPQINAGELKTMTEMSYPELALKVLSKYLADYTPSELKKAIDLAYNRSNFSSEEISPVVKLNENTFILELWHGPTAAFKDLALQVMPYLMVQALKKTDLTREIVILVATSGDTGKAALEGFKDVPGIRVIVFYPARGVSRIQELQMLSTGGNNTAVVAVKGNFDDCQTGVKQIFADRQFKDMLDQESFKLSSANSINWGRLVPQIIYYFKAYTALMNKGEIKPGERINVTVPTGNFGNILAGYYAYRMGLPVNRFICASNINKILTDFIRTGKYDIRREFFKTVSPSMDILISSNLERFLFEESHHDADKINSWYQDLESKGFFKVDRQTEEGINSLFHGESCTEERTYKTIKRVYDNYDYLLDTHTAVGYACYQDYLDKTGDNTVTIIDATANPYKFPGAVLKALAGKTTPGDEYQAVKKLQQLSGIYIPEAVKGLDKKEIRHHQSCQPEALRQEIKDILEI